MDVEWDVVGFSIGKVGAVSQVEGHVKEIHNFLVGFNCDLKAILVASNFQRFPLRNLLALTEETDTEILFGITRLIAKMSPPTWENLF